MPAQAAAACKAMNGTDLAGRAIQVREDREDRDVKVDGEGAPRRGERGPRQPREPRERRERAPRPPRDSSGSSGLQVVVQGIPWSYDNAALEDMFTSFKAEYVVEAAKVEFGRDGRSRVRDFKGGGVRVRAFAFGASHRSQPRSSNPSPQFLQGYGTVRFATAELAQMAIEDFHNFELESRTLTVKLDQYA